MPDPSPKIELDKNRTALLIADFYAEFMGNLPHSLERKCLEKTQALQEAARQAKEILASSETEWQRLSPRIRVTDASALAIYRQRYGEGIVRRPIADEEADARALYRVLAEIGGAELVGPARELAAGTFYRPAAGE